MGLYEIREHIPKADDRLDILHPRFEGQGIPRPETFHAVIYERLEKSRADMMAWRVTSVWFDHSTTLDFRVKNAFGYICGLPLLVPTCPKKLFEKGPRRKYVDIVADTLHASSSDFSDLITWNTLVLKMLKWHDAIPRMWLESQPPPWRSGTREIRSRHSCQTIEEDLQE